MRRYRATTSRVAYSHTILSGPIQLPCELCVVREPPVSNVNARGEPDAALGQRVVEELLQPGNAGRLADQPRMQPDRHHAGPLGAFLPVGIEGAFQRVRKVRG